MNIPISKINEIAKAFYLANSENYFIKKMENNEFVIDLTYQSESSQIISELKDQLVSITKNEQSPDEEYFKVYLLVFASLKSGETKEVKKLIEQTVLKNFRWIDEIFKHFNKDIIGTHQDEVERLDFDEDVESNTDSENAILNI